MEKIQIELETYLYNQYMSNIEAIRRWCPNLLSTDMQKEALLIQLNRIIVSNNSSVEVEVDGTSIQNNVESNSTRTVLEATDEKKGVSPPKRVLKEYRYAKMAVGEDNDFYFKRTSDTFDNNNHFFKLTIYTDGTGTFEMISPQELAPDMFQQLKDNIDDVMPSFVVNYVGSLNNGSNIENKELGELVKSGKSYRVIKPLKLEFK